MNEALAVLAVTNNRSSATAKTGRRIGHPPAAWAAKALPHAKWRFDGNRRQGALFVI